MFNSWICSAHGNNISPLAAVVSPRLSWAIINITRYYSLLILLLTAVSASPSHSAWLMHFQGLLVIFHFFSKHLSPCLAVWSELLTWWEGAGDHRSRSRSEREEGYNDKADTCSRSVKWSSPPTEFVLRSKFDTAAKFSLNSESAFDIWSPLESDCNRNRLAFDLLPVWDNNRSYLRKVICPSVTCECYLKTNLHSDLLDRARCCYWFSIYPNWKAGKWT